MTQETPGYAPSAAPTCYRHPDRQTYVRCARCDRPICPDCMREASVGHQCPECVAEGRATQRPARTAFGGGVQTGAQGTVTKTLIGVNVVVFLAGVLLSGGRSIGGLLSGASVLNAIGGVVGPPVGQYPGVWDGGWWRLVTAMFLHYGLLHLAVNMWALWVLGRSIEAGLGRGRFLALYLIAGLGGNVASLLFTPYSLAAGASTALFGMFAALFILLRRVGANAGAILPVIVINLVITFVVPGISVAGHLGGLVTGAIAALILAYAPQRNRSAIQWSGLAALTAVLLIAAGAATLAH